MKKLISALFVLLAFVSITKGEQYLQASSTITQCPGVTPEVVRIDVTDAANGITLADNKINCQRGWTLSNRRRAPSWARRWRTPWLF